MRYLSVCSGIEAASVAFQPLGWTAVGFSEIEPFPCAVLRHHYPETINFGDLTAFRSWPDATVDVLIGGTPCQSFSVAGLRKGLADPRGNLALTYLAVAERYRPRWVVWENVPGVLSSVSHDAPDAVPPPDDLDGDDGPPDGTEIVVEDEYDADESHAFGCFLAGLSDLGYGLAYRVLDAQYFGLAQRRKRVFVVGHLEDWRRAAAVLLEPSGLSWHPAPRRETRQGIADGAAPSLTASGRGVERTGESRGQDPVVFGSNADRASGSGPMVAFQEAAAFNHQSGGDMRGIDLRETAQLQRDQTTAAMIGMQVRRLTPTECARLQGFPDDYLDIIYNGKPAADGPKYKALGNSFAVPVVRWIGQRIQAVEDIPNEE